MTFAENLASQKFGRPDEPLDLTSSDDNRLAVVCFARQARRMLYIVSRDLGPKVFEEAETVAAIKDFVLGSRRATVRIIVRDVSRIISRGHRLVDLQRRLPSYMSIRTPAKEHQDYNSAFVVADQTAVLYRKFADRYEGTVSFGDPQSAEELTNLFDEMWEHASAPADLRNLVI